MHPFIARNFFYFPIQFFRKQYVAKYLHSMDKQQYLAQKDLELTRNTQISNLVKYAVSSIPFYKKWININPENIKNFDDLQQIPVLSKKTILDNVEQMINHDYQHLTERKTGGSTGMTLHFYKEPDILAKNDAVMWRCYKWYGIEIGDRQARFWGVPVNKKIRNKEKLKDFVLNRIRISAFDISKESCLKQYKQIKQFKPAYFYGYTTAIYGFALQMKEAGIDLNELGLQAVICTAEKMYPHHRSLFNEVFKCPVVDEYGSTENGIIAFQCRKGNMHLMADHLAIEFLDENGRRVKPGENGHIVITDLSSYAMPMIRYNIGDIGSPSEETCSCGCTLPLMNIVEGRKEDFIKTKQGKMVHAAYLCYTLKVDAVHEFKMIQKTIDHIDVQIVKSSHFDNTTEQQLISNLRTSLGDSITITFEYLNQIPREPSGKLRYFISEISEIPKGIS